MPAAAPEDKRTSLRRRGDEGEAQALAYLQAAGLKLVQQNFLCKGGEIDLIMQDGATLVFVEVRQRSSMAFGGAVASVTPAKQRRLVHAAQVYLQRQQGQPACRFDLVALDGAQLRWLQNIIVA
ncbi:MAG: YraN family protein [Burkholderiales bacterium]|nr:YraN family protein [Burkholderiales bacterium]